MLIHPSNDDDDVVIRRRGDGHYGLRSSFCIPKTSSMWKQQTCWRAIIMSNLKLMPIARTTARLLLDEIVLCCCYQR